MKKKLFGTVLALGALAAITGTSNARAVGGVDLAVTKFALESEDAAEKGSGQQALNQLKVREIWRHRLVVLGPDG